MSAAFALIILAEAAATCAPASRFAGGAVIVRPVGIGEPQPFKRLGPAPGVEKSKEIHQVGAGTQAKDREEDSTPQPCDAVVIHQV